MNLHTYTDEEIENILNENEELVAIFALPEDELKHTDHFVSRKTAKFMALKSVRDYLYKRHKLICFAYPMSYKDSTIRLSDGA
jgi:hypothetical protein